MASLTSAEPRRDFVRMRSSWTGLADIRHSLQANAHARYLVLSAILHTLTVVCTLTTGSSGPVAMVLMGWGLLCTVVALAHIDRLNSSSSFASESQVTGEAGFSLAYFDPEPLSEPCDVQIARQEQQRRDSATPIAIQPRVRIHGDSSWSELLSRVSHDLRTPLNAVIGFSDIMRTEIFGPLGSQRYIEYSDHIGTSGRSLLKSAEDTFALTSILASPEDHRYRAGVGIEALAQEAWAFHQIEHTRRLLSLSCRARADFDILGEPRVLRQIMINILAEAISKAPDGSEIVIRAKADGDLVELEVSAAAPAPKAERGNASLPICVARALLEHQGAYLLEFHGPRGGWRAVTILDRAVQQDFFRSTSSALRAQQLAH